MEQQIGNEQTVKTLLSELRSKEVSVQLYVMEELCKLFKEDKFKFNDLNLAKDTAIALLRIHKEGNMESREEAKITLANLILNVDRQIQKENNPEARNQLRDLLFTISSEGHLTPHLGWAAITKWARTIETGYNNSLLDGKFNLHTERGVIGKALQTKTPIN